MFESQRDDQDQPDGSAEPAPPQGPPPEADGQQPAEAPTGADLGALRAERDDLIQRLQRVSADYVNYQKRARRDVEQAREFANEQLIRALLTVLDDMERALAAARENHGEDDPLFKGMQLVHDNALRTLQAFGLEAIAAQDQPFDPELHRAVSQQPTGSCPAGIVLNELQRGYRLKGRTIRPSSVVVSSPPGDGEDA